MEHFANFLIKHRKLIGIIFFICTILCLYLDRFVVLNYDFSTYIPDDASSIVAFHKAEDEFGMNGTARVMFSNITLSDAAKYNEIIKEIDGIDQVMWLNDYTDVYQPVEFIDKELLNTYYKDGNTVMDILFSSDDYSDQTFDAYHKLKEALPSDGSVSYMGSAITVNSIRDNVKKEMVFILCIVIPVVIIVLFLTTDSWFSPLIFGLVIGISIILNKGTNIVFDSISYITYTITAALQLAISMDYSVFMLHQFEREREKGLEAEDAMRNTLKDGITTVASSALTTIAGFVALSFMGFGLGKDIGLVFSKGIVLSLICVIFLMPYLILTFYNKIEKYAHKSLFPNFDGFSKFVCKHKVFFLTISLVIIIPMFVAQESNNFKYGSAAVGAGPGTEVYIDEEKVKKVFGDNQFMLIIVPNTGYVDCNSLACDLENMTVKDIYGNDKKIIRYAKCAANTIPIGVPDFFAPQDILKKFKNDNYQRILVSARCDSESDLAFEVLDKTNELCKKYYNDDYYLTGTIPVTVDMKNVIEEDYKIVNLISIFAILLILLFTFKSILLPVLLVAVIEGAIFINMGIPYLLDQDMIFVGYLIVSTIQLGATIDYAILMTDNYLTAKEEYDNKEAIKFALTKTLPSLLTTGGILAICGYTIRLVSTIAAVADMGELVGRGALISMLLVIFMLPQVLVVFDKLIEKTTLSNDFKLRIHNKVYDIGRRTWNDSKRLQSLHNENQKLISKVTKRIEYKKNKLNKKLNSDKENINKRNIKRLDRAINKLIELKSNLEKETLEEEKLIKKEEKEMKKYEKENNIKESKKGE